MSGSIIVSAVVVPFFVVIMILLLVFVLYRKKKNAGENFLLCENLRDRRQYSLLILSEFD